MAQQTQQQNSPASSPQNISLPPNISLSSNITITPPQPSSPPTHQDIGRVTRLIRKIEISSGKS